MMPEYLTIHDTGNTSAYADAEAHAAYLLTSTAANAPVSWHFTTDGGSIAKPPQIYQSLPTNESGFHAGDGATGQGNRNSIGIETCMNVDGNRTTAEIMTIDLAIWLMDNVPSLKPFPHCFRQHFHWSGKNCPQIIRNRHNGWANFLGTVASRMNNAEKEIRHLHQLGIISSPDYWIRNAVAGKQIEGVFVQTVLRRASNKLKEQDALLLKYKQAGKNMLNAGQVFK